MASPPPPLPLGWTEHVGPNGQPYYFNAKTSESTYVRPLPALAVPKQQQKDKPLVKTPVPGTDWIRVRTTQGNLFYSHKVEKKSIWTVPDEIRDAVEALERQEKEDQERVVREQEEESVRAETERVKAQVLKETAKRKALDPVPVDEEMAEEESEQSEEEDWQKEAAAQLAVEAEEEAVRRKAEEEEENRAAEEALVPQEDTKNNAPPPGMPTRADLSLEEGKALFKTLLREKDVNPLHPWDTSLPLFISDYRYILLPSVSARREAFDEYCRERAREIRQSKVSKEKEDPKEDFEKLLKDEVKSTRTSWNDFRRQWKKDRRFYGWGRDEREREKRFRDYLKELGEKKRVAAQKAEAEFFILLKEAGTIKEDANWKDVKRKISADPRYEAVGSSSLREELFNTFRKATTSTSGPSQAPQKDDTPPPQEDEAELERKRKEKKERAVREREQKVRSEMSRVEADIGRSKMGLNKEEDEREFRTLLTDAVRDPQVTWESVAPRLRKDPRFSGTQLPMNQQLHLFHQHVESLRSKHLHNLHALFGSHTPSLATKFSTLPIESLLSSLPASKLGFTEQKLQNEFEKWQRERSTTARKDFDEMLSENAFLEFWGRLGKIGGKGVDETILNDDIGEEEGEEGDRVDMKKLAKGIDIKEIVKVLKNDKRYIMFEHVPEQREQWIRDYVGNMTAPQLSVHVPERSGS